ncbi:thiamine pyrophosphate-dependent enzyme [Myxococcota bacterium]|nr:thiamine pyrophosphate-dependent enzyme [Myxococcota bacterium]
MPPEENPTAPAHDAPHPALPEGAIRLLNPDGTLVPGAQAPMGREEAVRLYEAMRRQRILDERMLVLQRQGRIGFYGAAQGEEAAVFASAAALRPTDWVVPALRQAGILLMRGLPLYEYLCQLLGNADDVTRGRQMPCHPEGSRFHYLTMSSCIATQVPHATGLALAAKKKGRDDVAVGYTGDGATSEGDFHAGLVMAAALRAPAVFVVQNNQWSISVPVSRQSAARNLASRARATGIPSALVDGNDAFAVYDATRRAVERARSGGGPSLIEAYTYRMGAHTTSDDPSRYRDEGVTAAWRPLDPVDRLRRWLERAGLWTGEREEALSQGWVQEIKEVWARAEAVPRPGVDSLFEDVFRAPTGEIVEQRDALRAHVERFGSASDEAH